MIDELEAGPELDALIAEKVMGWKLGKPEMAHEYDLRGMVEIEPWEGSLRDDRFYCKASWRPSTDIAAAWKVVEQFRRRSLNYWPVAFNHSGWECHLSNNPPPLNGDSGTSYGHAAEAPLAICRAALKAVEISQRQDGEKN